MNNIELDARIISGLIALTGVILSVVISFISNRSILRSKIRELEMQTLQQTSNRLAQKRLEVYPVIYFCISNVSKKLKKDLLLDRNVFVTKEVIKKFFKDYELLNSKHALLFSYQSGLASGILRNYLFYMNCKDELFTLGELGELKRMIGSLELSLKQEIGIYIDELQNPEVGRSLKDYSDVDNYSKQVEELKKDYYKRQDVLIDFIRSEEVPEEILKVKLE